MLLLCDHDRTCLPHHWLLFVHGSRGRIYANMDELYQEVAPDEEDPYGYGDESIYDSICYYQAPVG